LGWAYNRSFFFALSQQIEIKRLSPHKILIDNDEKTQKLNVDKVQGRQGC
jgi:hypothetical protein